MTGQAKQNSKPPPPLPSPIRSRPESATDIHVCILEWKKQMTTTNNLVVLVGVAEAESGVDKIDYNFPVVDIKILLTLIMWSCNGICWLAEVCCFIVGSDSPPFGTLETNTKDLNMLTVWWIIVLITEQHIKILCIHQVPWFSIQQIKAWMMSARYFIFQREHIEVSKLKTLLYPNNILFVSGKCFKKNYSVIFEAVSS